MRVRISVTVEGQTRSIDIESPDDVSILKATIKQNLELDNFIMIPYTNIIYRCATIDRVQVQEW